MRWLYTLDVKDDWHRAKRGEIDAQSMAQIVADKLSALMGHMISSGPVGDLRDSLEELQDEFDGAAKDPKFTANQFDDIWGRLYDWADTPLNSREKICWVRVF